MIARHEGLVLVSGAIGASRCACVERVERSLAFAQVVEVLIAPVRRQNDLGAAARSSRTCLSVTREGRHHHGLVRLGGSTRRRMR